MACVCVCVSTPTIHPLHTALTYYVQCLCSLFVSELVVVVGRLVGRQKRYSHNKFFFMFIYNDATLLYYRDLYITLGTQIYGSVAHSTKIEPRKAKARHAESTHFPV